MEYATTRRACATALLCATGVVACYGGSESTAGSGTATATDGPAPGSEGSGDESGGAEPPADVDLVPETMSRRMTPTELDQTLRQLIADHNGPAREFLNDPDFNPFDNDYALQDPSRVLVESLEVVALDTANRLMAEPGRLEALVPCVPAGPNDAACMHEFVEAFGRRALRRPLTKEEIDAYLSLQSFATEENPYVDNDFYTAVGLVVQAVVQDPEFLYRLEVGTPTTEQGIYQLDEWEIATRISFMLWGSTPDDELLAEAEAGNLSDPDRRRDAVARLLGSDRAREQVYRYHAMWLGYRAIPHDAELVAAFGRETNALIDRVVFDDDAPYSAMFTMDETWVDDALAAHYGLPPPPGGEGWVSYEGTGRAGILGHGAVLAAFSKFDDTSPTQRGLFVRRRLTCAEIPPPPPEVDVDAVPQDPDDPNACKEERYAAHRETASCAACHDNFDPIGLGLENYDIAGVFREHDDGRPECVISGQGALPGVGEFSGPEQLGERLIESGRLEACAVQHYLTFAYGRALSDHEIDTHVPAALEKFEDEGWSFTGLVTELVADEVFGFRREPE